MEMACIYLGSVFMIFNMNPFIKDLSRCFASRKDASKAQFYTALPANSTFLFFFWILLLICVTNLQHCWLIFQISATTAWCWENGIYSMFIRRGQDLSNYSSRIPIFWQILACKCQIYMNIDIFKSLGLLWASLWGENGQNCWKTAIFPDLKA